MAGILHHHFEINYGQKQPKLQQCCNSLVSQQGTLSPYHQFFAKGKTSMLDTVQRFEICAIANHVPQGMTDAEKDDVLALNK